MSSSASTASSASTPIPKPRTQRSDIGKRPIPLPRHKLAEPMEDEAVQATQAKSTIFGTLKGELKERRRRLSDEIVEHRNAVLEKKRVVLETARNAKNQVVRKFNSLHRDGSVTPEVVEDKTQSLPPTSEIFQGISFESPCNEPPNYPPPNLPDESVYDEPQTAGNNTTSSSSSNAGTLSSVSLSYYEEIFPEGLLSYAQQHANSSDSESEKPKTTLKHRVNRSDSWSFYDGVSRNENIYNNIEEESDENIYANSDESTGSIKEETISEEIKPVPPQRKSRPSSKKIEDFSKMNILRLSEISSISVQNTLYENHILEPEKVIRRDSSQSESTPRVTESMIYEFDPLKRKNLATEISSLSTEQDLSFLESILQGDTYGTFNHTQSDWSSSHSDEETDLEVPPAPPRYDSLPNDIDQVPSATWFIPSPDTPTPLPEPSTTPTEKTNWMKQRLSGVFQKFVNSDNKTNLNRGSSFRASNVTDNVMKVVGGKPPAMLGQSIVTHQGLMLKIGRCGGIEDLLGDINPRWCYLGNGKLTCYNDNTLKVVKETIMVDTILSVQLISQNRIM